MTLETVQDKELDPNTGPDAIDWMTTLMVGPIWIGIIWKKVGLITVLMEPSLVTP